MKVKELIKKLEKMDPDLLVEAESDDGGPSWGVTHVRKVQAYRDHYVVELS